MSYDLEPYENVTRVFWIKIELRENQQDGNQISGEVRDVLSGRRCAINNLVDISKFILPYLFEMGVHINWFQFYAAFFNLYWAQKKDYQRKPPL